MQTPARARWRTHLVERDDERRLALTEQAERLEGLGLEAVLSTSMVSMSSFTSEAMETDHDVDDEDGDVAE